jgi:hypothetical protein
MTHVGLGSNTQRFVKPPRAELIALLTVAALLLGGVIAAGLSLGRDVFSASAFVAQYLRAVADRDIETALSIPGVLPAGVNRDEFLNQPKNVLLTSAAINSDLKFTVIRDEERDGIHHVFAQNSEAGSRDIEFLVAATGRNAGLFPQWTFVSSPLGSIDVVTTHATFFSVNGFGPIDLASVTTSVFPQDFAAHGTFAVFTPGTYVLETTSSSLTSKPVTLSLTQPGSEGKAEIIAEPTTAFITRVQNEVNQFFEDCVRQRVLLPAGCPFGISVENRISGKPQWGIVNRPNLTLRPGESGWEIIPAVWTLSFDAEIQSLFDGSISTVHEEIPLTIGGRVVLTASGDISVTIDRVD